MEQDQAAYAEAFKETARRLLAERELSVRVEVVVNQSLDESVESSTDPLREAAPGDLAHVDITKQGRIPGGGGWRSMEEDHF